MKKTICLLIFIIAFSISLFPNEDNPVVVFPDKNLQKVIRHAVGKHKDGIHRKDLLSISELDAENKGISDLTGLEYCTNLEWLNLSHNKINSIGAIKGLTNLSWLDLHDNKITDINTLSNLKKLTELYLDDNKIGDMNALAGLTNLARLNLEHNKIISINIPAGFVSLAFLWLNYNKLKEIKALPVMTKLEGLWLGYNDLTDINALSDMANMETLDLSHNSISDISALVKCCKAGGFRQNGYESSIMPSNPDVKGWQKVTIPVSRGIDLQGNSLSSKALNMDIPYLKKMDVKIYYQKK